MSDSQNLNAIDVYNAIRNFGRFLKTDVKVSGVTIDCVFKGSDAKILNVPGFTVEVEISNTAPVETSYPLIVFMGVGLRVKFPETTKEGISFDKISAARKIASITAPI